AYEDLALKFAEHFVWIAAAVNGVGGGGLWDEQDGFYYDQPRLQGGTATPLKVRSMVGLLPLCATTIVEKYQREQVPMLVHQFAQAFQQSPTLQETIHPTGPSHF